ncbi:MAG: serine hydrolase domain-containing protein [Paracoccaceae bacterium]|nr:serine hydrolase domain-containing protein [Paracoccaceae bacterium]
MRGLLALVFLLAPSFAAAGSEIERRLEALLTEFRATYGFPGATAAFVLPNGSVGGTAVGLADVEAARPMTPDSRMLAASIGKTFVGALVVDLEREHTLSRGDLVEEHLGGEPWFSRLPNATTMTVGHLLNHTSGLPDHVHMDGVVAELFERRRDVGFQPIDAISHVLDQPPLFEAGSAWAYSDTGYLLIGLVIEAASGEAFYSLVEERFLSPLALNATAPSASPKLAGLATGYTTDDNPFGLSTRTMDSEGALLWNPAVEWTGGGFASTSRDLARWGHALFTGGALEGRYLPPLLEGVPVHPDAPGVLFASGVAIYEETEFGRVYGLGGWVPGYVSSLRHYADSGVTIAFQINTDVGVVDDSTDLAPALEAAFADLILKTPVGN